MKGTVVFWIIVAMFVTGTSIAGLLSGRVGPDPSQRRYCGYYEVWNGHDCEDVSP